MRSTPTPARSSSANRTPRRLPDGLADDLQAFAAARRGRRGDRRPAATADRARGRMGAGAAVLGRRGPRSIRARSAVARRDAPVPARRDRAARASSSPRRRPRSAEILGHHALREAGVRDPLTGLGNRRKLAADVDAWPPGAGDSTAPAHALRPQRLQGLQRHVRPCRRRCAARRASEPSSARPWRRYGEAYRLGGDEFCAVLDDRRRPRRRDHRDRRAGAQRDRRRLRHHRRPTAWFCCHTRPTTSITPSSSPTSACTRTSTNRSSGARDQARDVLMRTMHAKQPSLHDHSSHVAELAVARRPPLRHDRRGGRRGRPRRGAARRRQGRRPRRDPRQARPARPPRMGVHAPAHDPRRAHPQRRGGAAPGRAARALKP